MLVFAPWSGQEVRSHGLPQAQDASVCAPAIAEATGFPKDAKHAVECRSKIPTLTESDFNMEAEVQKDTENAYASHRWST